VRDEAWFDRMVEDTFERVLRYALRRVCNDEADDVVAETYLVAWRRRGDVPEPPEDVLWLFGVARHQLANMRRSARRRKRLRLALARERPTAGRAADDPRVEAVRDAMRRLPEPDAEVLRLVAWDGLSHREAAVVLGVTENAVALRSSRARRRLAELMDRFSASPDMEG
jgi:RNA polymerase sigma-70 factor (ECF subfamily)